MTWSKSNGLFLLTTDKTRFQPGVIQGFLKTTYWAHHRNLDAVLRSLENSLAFGLYKGDEQVGLARIITDFATMAYVADVFVVEKYRGQGLGRWMTGEILSHPSVRDVELWYLGTKDKHALYAGFGFTKLKYPERQMEWRRNRPSEPEPRSLD